MFLPVFHCTLHSPNSFRQRKIGFRSCEARKTRLPLPSEPEALPYLLRTESSASPQLGNCRTRENLIERSTLWPACPSTPTQQPISTASSHREVYRAYTHLRGRSNGREVWLSWKSEQTSKVRSLQKSWSSRNFCAKCSAVQKSRAQLFFSEQKKKAITCARVSQCIHMYCSRRLENLPKMFRISFSQNERIVSANVKIKFLF